MFPWSKPKCPVSADVKAWVESRTAWLIDQFGWRRMLDATVALPTEEYFPNPRGSAPAETEPYVRELLEHVARYMDVEPDGLELEFYSQHRPVAFGANLTSSEPGADGVYDERDGVTTIWLDTSGLGDLVNVAATIAHELAHVRLLGERRLAADEEDMEPLTDLATVFFGLGVLSANAGLRSHASHAGIWESWGVSRHGYLNAEIFAYALATFGWLRGETNPAWAKSLRADVREKFFPCLDYLAKTEDSLLQPPTWPLEKGPDVSALACEPKPFPQGVLSNRPEEEPPEDEDIEFEPRTADDFFTRGTAHALHENWEHALADFDQSIRLCPEDGECYQQRAMVLCRLERYAEAVADADEAVRLDPDDSENYRTRGIARISAEDHKPAIDDLSRYIREEKRVTGMEKRVGEAYYYRALAYAALRKWRRAIADFTRATCLAPAWAELYVERAAAYEQLGKTKKAAADRNSAVRYGWDPNGPTAP